MNKAVLLTGLLALHLFPLVSFAEGSATPTVQVGVVAQHYPWNGVVDVSFKLAGAPAAGATVTIVATVKGGAPITVATVTAAKNGEGKTSFNANDHEALRGRQLKDVTITAKAVAGN